MELWTDAPGVVLYSGGFLPEGLEVNGGRRSVPSCAVALEACAAEPTCLPEKMHTAEELRAALEEKRAWAAPFLQNLAPRLECCREVVDLKTFRYQKTAQSQWETVTIPHYDGPLGNARSFYETNFTLPALHGRRAWLVVNGADYKAAAYVNGRLAGTHEGFFATFQFEVDDAYLFGRDLLICPVPQPLLQPFRPLLLCSASASPWICTAARLLWEMEAGRCAYIVRYSV